MDIYIYSDESGVFDKKHNDYFVFAGVVLLGEKSKDDWIHRYSAAEKAIRNSRKRPASAELKASSVSNSQKMKLFRSLNNCRKFSVIVHQQRLLDSVFCDKKTRQRYLDFAYKIAVKRAFEQMICEKAIIPSNVENLIFNVDEHTTATNGRYELREGLEQEFKYGTHNWNYNKYFPPLFPSVKSVSLAYCNSEKRHLIRASDIIANRVYYLATCKNAAELDNIKNMYSASLP